jgi:hypothetical protein
MLTFYETIIIEAHKNLPSPGGREGVKKSLKASRLGGDVVEVLQRHLMTSSRRDVKTLVVWPAYDVLLPLFSQMIRNCKTLKIPLPDLLLNFFTASGDKGEGD